MSGLFAKKKAEIPAPQKNERELPTEGDVRILRLGVIVGHEAAAPGADLVGYTGGEYAYNKEVARLMDLYAKSKIGIKIETILRDGIGIEGAYDTADAIGCDAVIELHFNAFNGKVKGTETLCSPDLNDVEFAHAVHKSICQVFSRDGASRGVKTIPRSARGGINVYSFKAGVNCIVEPFFGDNEDEAHRAMARQSEYAMALVDSVILWAKKKDLI